METRTFNQFQGKFESGNSFGFQSKVEVEYLWGIRVSLKLETSLPCSLLVLSLIAVTPEARSPSLQTKR